MDKIKEHFEKEASKFDEVIPKLIPYYNQMLDGIITSIPFSKDKNIKAIDLGCGTGTLSKKFKEKYPNATLTCLDIAENMIESSKIKLEEFSDIRYQVNDFNNHEFDENYDLAISSLALHHLATDDDKINFYKKIYMTLNTNGAFIIADVILGSNNSLQETYINKWKSFMKKSISEKEIDDKWLQKYKEEDYPSPLINQITWLKEIGFVDIDIVWKYYNFAVYGGIKKYQKLIH